MAEPPGLIDTDILIDAARGLSEAVAFVSTQQTLGCSVSVVSAMELVVGCRNKQEIEQIKQFLARVNLVLVSESVSLDAMHLVESYWPSHGLLLPDAFIASSARIRGIPLYTKNIRHFRMIPDLTVVRPY